MVVSLLAKAAGIKPGHGAHKQRRKAKGGYMKWLRDIEGVATSDPWYDLTSGGYIDPAKLLEPDDAQRVKEAADLIMEFFSEGEDNGMIELM